MQATLNIKIKRREIFHLFPSILLDKVDELLIERKGNNLEVLDIKKDKKMKKSSVTHVDRNRQKK